MTYTAPHATAKPIGQTIGLSVGVHFAEAAAKTTASTQPLVFDRWYLPKTSLAEGLRQFLTRVESDKISDAKHIHITTDFPQYLIQRRAGNKVALIVTQGFERWPILRQPCVTSHFVLNPRRAETLINSDYIFGITERMSPEGAVLTDLQVDELEFLISKLEMMGVKHVALGFLHSMTNPAHELRAGEILRARGFHVSLSHEIATTSNEVARWWRATLNAYVASSFQEVWTSDVQKVVQEFNLQTHFLSASGQLVANPEAQFFETAFSKLGALANCYRNSHILHLGLEDFWWCYSGSTQSEKEWKSEFGPVALKSFPFEKLPVQPLSLIRQSLWGVPDFTLDRASFEPGPMLMGRSHQLTYFDLLGLAKYLPEIKGVTIKDDKKTLDRAREAVFTLSKSHHGAKAAESEEIIAKLTELALHRVAHVVLKKHLLYGETLIHCTGPFAAQLLPKLKKMLPQLEFRLMPYAEFGESLANVEWSAVNA